MRIHPSATALVTRVSTLEQDEALQHDAPRRLDGDLRRRRGLAFPSRHCAGMTNRSPACLNPPQHRVAHPVPPRCLGRQPSSRTGALNPTDRPAIPLTQRPTSGAPGVGQPAPEEPPTVVSRLRFHATAIRSRTPRLGSEASGHRSARGVHRFVMGGRTSVLVRDRHCHRCLPDSACRQQSQGLTRWSAGHRSTDPCGMWSG